MQANSTTHINWLALVYCLAVISYQLSYTESPVSSGQVLLFSTLIGLELSSLALVYWKLSWSYYCASTHQPQLGDRSDSIDTITLINLPNLKTQRILNYLG